jgi:hypothetical protein
MTPPGTTGPFIRKHIFPGRIKGVFWTTDVTRRARGRRACRSLLCARITHLQIAIDAAGLHLADIRQFMKLSAEERVLDSKRTVSKVQCQFPNLLGVFDHDLSRVDAIQSLGAADAKDGKIGTLRMLIALTEQVLILSLTTQPSRRACNALDNVRNSNQGQRCELECPPSHAV